MSKEIQDNKYQEELKFVLYKNLESNIYGTIKNPRRKQK